jgi:putative transposase
MKLVERHVIGKNHPYFKEIDKLCFLSKNLYNASNYLIRQEFINNNIYLGLGEVYKLMKTSPDYKALPSKVSNGVLRLLDRNWKSFFSAMKEWNLNPDKFNGRPNLPRYKDKVKGRNILVYELGAISKPSLRNGIVKLSRTSFFIPTGKTNIKEVRIVPKTAQYIIEIVYDYGETPLSNSQPGIASVDLGLNNLATIGSNIKGFKPLIINGKPLKSINQYYNKYRAELQSQLQKKEPNRYTSNRIDKLTAKRNNKIETYLHQASRTVINYLLQNHIGTLVIGNNQEWKQSINIGKRNNQNFVTIPHYKFISQLIYKAELAGIKVILREEAYTSKSSFLDLDPIPNYEKGKNYSFSGKRIKRGLYRSKDGILINSDLNGSLNILRKEFPNAFAEGIEGVAASPFRFTPGKVAL